MFKSKDEFKVAYQEEFLRTVAEPFETCDPMIKYQVLARLISARVSVKAVETQQRQNQNYDKKVYYFSMEFLIGRLLKNYLINLGVDEMVRDGLAELGADLDDICAYGPAPGLGNGGLGRLAACFMDSLASLNYAGYGMGIKYRYGLFRQKIVDGRQVEVPDNWLDKGYPWEMRRQDEAVEVRFGGHVDRQLRDGAMIFSYHGYQSVEAVPYDIPIVGYNGTTVNMLRLWRAKPLYDKFDLTAFNQGDYNAAMRDRNEIEAITSVLYPDDSTNAGKLLRLKQEYFLCAAGVASILRDYRERFGLEGWAELPRRVSIHINDTHPTLCIPELMRILMDDYGLGWDEAWRITTSTVSYTNHTVLPEALEKWPLELMKGLLPRIYMIIEEIDRRHRDRLMQTREDWHELYAGTAVLWDGQVRMANLSVIGSHSVNGVAALHTEILKKDVLRPFYELEPEKFNNKTNGVSHRRFVMEANQALSALLDDAIGREWRVRPSALTSLLKYENDEAFLEKLAEVKLANKRRLAYYIKKTTGLVIDPASVFDVQVKRIHAYKRQLLNVMKIMALYNRLHDDPAADIQPHTFIFAGKAAQSYVFAKDVVHLICSVAELVNNDPVCKDILKVVFVEDFGVGKAQLIYPAADISEQISTAGKEASGTGNMKFMFNGAITLGTLDGANIELLEQAGRENICIFGLTAEQVMEYYQNGAYNSQQVCDADPRLSRICSQLVDGTTLGGESFWGIYDALLRYNDEYFVLADFAAYMEAWERLSRLYRQPMQWQQKSLHNIAKAGYFSSDRTIKEYADDIWHLN